jgi:inactivated superfamily I helicase
MRALAFVFDGLQARSVRVEQHAALEQGSKTKTYTLTVALMRQFEAVYERIQNTN